MIGISPSRQDPKMASRSASQQLPQGDALDRKCAAFQANTSSPKIRFVRQVTTPPILQAPLLEWLNLSEGAASYRILRRHTKRD